MKLKCPVCNHTSFSYDISSISTQKVFWKYTCTWCYRTYHEHNLDKILVVGEKV